MAKLDLVSNEWTDLVFEGRNQAYGAYKLRKGTTKRNVWSILIVALAALLLFIGLSIQKMVEANRTVENTQAIELSALEQKKKEAKVEKKEVVKVEPEKVVEKVKSSIKFTAPVIKKDNEVKDDEEIDLQKVENTNTTIGAFDVQGNDEVGGEVLKAKEEIAQPEPPKHEEENKVFDVVEQMPSFPGGMPALMQWLSQNIKYPVIAAENGVQGRVIVQFVVEKDGSVTDVHVAKSVDPSLDKEATRVVKAMPKWNPGKQNGSAVRVKYTVPVMFKLQ
ncbi:MAG: energy transducer TonB [Prevotella sp.]|nr:energy transducer TonB [Prevotella sp.]MBQ6033587.1 energy transducer TonB [Prevotella sp.]MBQ6659219.1 energy transducer TonB [Prevotella sp.]MBQ7441371.1 energy transducer TonB [Prevotella sp.]MBQ7716326.1 energy transducer TonB [Prevotella sp.]